MYTLKGNVDLFIHLLSEKHWVGKGRVQQNILGGRVEEEDI